MAHIIAFANQKGGVGKTMTVAATASVLTQEGYQVLLLDMDAQRNLDMVAGDFEMDSLVIPKNNNTIPSMLHVLKEECTLEDAIVHSAIGDLVRASNLLYGWQGNRSLPEGSVKNLATLLTDQKAVLENPELSPEQMVARLRIQSQLMEETLTKNGTQPLETLRENKIPEYRILEHSLAPVKNNYDYILIDTNPSLTLLTLNALYACQHVVIPSFPEASALEAILELFDTVQHIKDLNPYRELEILGVLRTKYAGHRKKSQRHDDILKNVVEAGMNCRLFETKIRESERASEYVEARLDIVRHDPTGKTAMDYRSFVKELKACLGGKGKE